MPEPEVIVVPATEAVTTDPAPVTTTDPPAVSADPAPAATTPEPIEEPQGAKPSKVVEELKAQRKKRQDAEREAAYWKGVAEGRGKQEPSAPAQEVQSPAVPTAPKLDQFETYEQYEAAKDVYLVELAKHQIRVEYTQTQQQQAARTVEQKFQQRIDAAVKDDPTLTDVINDPSLPISIHMIPLLKESENAPKMLRWLDQNREDARRIASLPPLQAAREMGIIEAKISFTSKAEPVRVVSSAPEPVKPVAAVSAAVVDEDDLPMEEYHRRRTSQLTGGARQ